MFFYVLIILFFVLFIEAVSKHVERKKLTGYCDFCFLKNILFLFMEQFFWADTCRLFDIEQKQKQKNGKYILMKEWEIFLIC